MSLAVAKTSHASPLSTFSGPSRSRLFTALLDANHDAWRVVRRDHAWSFYREIGHDHPLLPFGAVVLTTEPGKPQTFDVYTCRGKRSLLTTYGDEVAHATQILRDREHILALFTKCAVELRSSNWDHQLRFSGDQLTERSAKLRYGTGIYERVVGSARPHFSRSWTKVEGLALPRTQAGLVVSQQENDVPMVRCLISYPRTIEATFLSSRLRPGLDAITGSMVSFIIDLNRSVEERRYIDEGEF